ncbi:MAG: motility associated factor glycosyltransferase family protein [Spirochaetes bacterium]|nr:motility associated factor glycosyltransferase family protein [Spirochaetota bacterium]
MKHNPVYQRNMLALTTNNPELAAYITSLQKTETVKIVTARSGHPVPAVMKNGRLTPIHSTFDPIKEGERYLAIGPKSGYKVIFGFGAGYHILPFLSFKNISSIIVIEKDAALFTSILGLIDLRKILLDSRVRILLDLSPKKIADFFLEHYFPAVFGDLQTLFLRSRYNMEQTYFEEIIDSIKEVIGRIADDYTVQAHFGKKWFINTLYNLYAAGETSGIIPPVRSVIITGAGPSLENQITQIKQLKKDNYLLATDTSLPVLLANDIMPDIVISIDCQHISYHHFLQGYPENVPLVLDLASPPLLTRLSKKTIFFSSGHPFSLYVSKNWRHFPVIDTSGGNVTHAAISLTEKLEAQRVYLFGVDYSYPEGKAYSRGTYIYPLFRSMELRTKPLESLLFSFIMRNKTIERITNNGVIIYTTRPMSSYRVRLESLINTLNSNVIQAPGMGIPLHTNNTVKRLKRNSNLYSLFSAGSSPSDWLDFIYEYYKKVKKLPTPFAPIDKYFKNLKSEEKNIWITQFPAAAAIRESHGIPDINSLRILEKVRLWTLSRIELILNQAR